ncbi:MAG: histidine phosphatase family protein [Oculatellaceae cyanobacterium Prado106]|nr:histidine phosphatase family protein [Oculatellaceae cyanobacterium Prado106]
MILVRHGESTFNAQRKVQGHNDESSLTEAGLQGASQVGSALQDLSFAAVYSSPFKRARETTNGILSQMTAAKGSTPPTPQFTDNLREISLPLWEGLTFDEVESKFPELYRCWRDRPHELCMPLVTEAGTEEFYPVVALYEQAKRFWQETLPCHAEETILVVAHSGINRCLISAAMNLGVTGYKALYQSNCGISVVNFSGVLGDPAQLESMNQTGHLGEPLPKIRKNQKGPRLLLVRHGETEWNRQKRFQGQIDVPLNDNGRTQSQQAGAFLQSTRIDRAVTSPMLRPKETAEIILQHHPHIPLELEDNLQEISHGLWEGKLEAEIEQEFPGELQRWQQTPAEVQMPEGENLNQVWERAIAAWEKIVASTSANPADSAITVLVVAHDAVNKAILCHLAGQGPEAFWSFKQGNGAVSVIDYPDGATGRPVIQAMNLTHHQGGVLDKTAAGAL